MEILHRNQVLFVPAGLLLGFIILHPYSMLVQWFMSRARSESIWSSIGTRALDSFDPVMFTMGLAFALFGGMIGFLFAIVTDRKQKLLVSKHEKEKQEIALQTIYNLMVTLSHHLLNSNMIIGGKVRHCRKLTGDLDLLDCLKVIEDQGRKIDAVLKTLRNLVEIHTVGYTSDGLVSMLDISKNLKEQFSESDLIGPEPS